MWLLSSAQVAIKVQHQHIHQEQISSKSWRLQRDHCLGGTRSHDLAWATALSCCLPACKVSCWLWVYGMTGLILNLTWNFRTHCTANEMFSNSGLPGRKVPLKILASRGSQIDLKISNVEKATVTTHWTAKEHPRQVLTKLFCSNSLVKSLTATKSDTHNAKTGSGINDNSMHSLLFVWLCFVGDTSETKHKMEATSQWQTHAQFVVCLMEFATNLIYMTWEEREEGEKTLNCRNAKSESNEHCMLSSTGNKHGKRNRLNSW